MSSISLAKLSPSYKGKVREIYEVGEKKDQLLIVASDRISAFDVIFNEEMQGKGQVLTEISNHWFTQIDFIKNHLIATDVAKFPEPFNQFGAQLEGRAVLAYKALRIDFECIVRGYLMGSGYKSYKSSGKVFGYSLPENMQLGDKLPLPIFTPTTKSDDGKDEPISYEEVQDVLGEELSEKIKSASLQIYQWASEKLEKNDIILMDTKFEFGLLDGELILIDEVLTPDSSRFCFRSEFDAAIEKQMSPPSADKQIIRNYLETLDWNKLAPPPVLPENIIEETMNKYREIKQRVLCVTKG